MKTREELKTEAKTLLRGTSSSILSGSNFWMLFLATLTSGALSFLVLKLDSPFLSSIFNIVVAPLLSLGLVSILKGLYENKTTEYNRLFKIFTEGSNYKIILISLLYAIITVIGTLLFLIPGIIFTYRYILVFKIFMDDTTQGVWECFKRSSAIMKGHKFEYFIFKLSFLPWYLLSVITFGIAIIYVYPYLECSTYVYYRDLLENYNNPEN